MDLNDHPSPNYELFDIILQAKPYLGTIRLMRLIVASHLRRQTR